MKIIPLHVSGVWLASWQSYEDERGNFREWFKHSDIFTATGLDFSVAQANFSESKNGVVRGIHYSLADPGQAKWLTCLSGSIKDVIVDLRQGSPTFGEIVEINLSGSSQQAVLISPGLGHGFISLKDKTTVAYLITSPFSPSEEFAINPLDPTLKIDWELPGHRLILSERDSSAPSLLEQMSCGKLPK